jgi:hypothetical protein
MTPRPEMEPEQKAGRSIGVWSAVRPVAASPLE